MKVIKINLKNMTEKAPGDNTSKLSVEDLNHLREIMELSENDPIPSEDEMQDKRLALIDELDNRSVHNPGDAAIISEVERLERIMEILRS